MAVSSATFAFCVGRTRGVGADGAQWSVAAASRAGDRSGWAAVRASRGRQPAWRPAPGRVVSNRRLLLRPTPVGRQRGVAPLLLRVYGSEELRDGRRWRGTVSADNRPMACIGPGQSGFRRDPPRSSEAWVLLMLREKVRGSNPLSSTRRARSRRPPLTCGFSAFSTAQSETDATDVIAGTPPFAYPRRAPPSAGLSLQRRCR